MSQDILDFIQEMTPQNKHYKLKLLMSEVEYQSNQDIPAPFHREEKDFDDAYELISLAYKKAIEKYK